MAAGGEYKQSEERMKRRRVHRCPRCHGVRIERVARQGLIERFVLPLILRRVYRCRECSERFHDRPS
jgi:hypothetical protein